MDDSFAVTADPKRWKSALRGGGLEVIPRIHFNSTDPVTCWKESEPNLSHWDAMRAGAEAPVVGREMEVEICVAPVLVCSEVRVTVGAGDNISAAALRSQTTSRAANAMTNNRRS